jgi:hypothetical protein
MKYILIPILLFILSISRLNGQKPEVVNTIVKEDKPHAFFVKQAELWWKETEKDTKNEKAWFNYYRANRYAKMTFENCNTPECVKFTKWIDESIYLKEAEDITSLISKAIPETYTYYIVIKEGYPNDQKRLDALQKAYDLQPDNPDTYDEFVVYYETNNLPQKRKEFNLKWFSSNDISSGILNYNYNVLTSMNSGGVILTFGDNDTFPIWMLQDALDIRKDITVLNVHLLSIPEYRKNIFKKLNIPMLSKDYPNGSTFDSQKEIIDHIIKNKPDELSLYISTPAWKQLQDSEKDLYLVGLVLEYSKENIDNIALLKNNFENLYALDYIKNQFNYDISREVVQRMNVNYLPGIIKLYQHYKLSGENEKAEKIKQVGLFIADKGGEDWKIKAEETLR